MSEKLTQCGCDVCEDKATKLLQWVDEVCNRYPSNKKVECVNSYKIPNVPR